MEWAPIQDRFIISWHNSLATLFYELCGNNNFAFRFIEAGEVGYKALTQGQNSRFSSQCELR
jgi:hypothetical protein